MIGEFCPKVFALNIRWVFSLKTVEFEFGCRRVGRDRHFLKKNSSLSTA